MEGLSTRHRCKRTIPQNLRPCWYEPYAAAWPAGRPQHTACSSQQPLRPESCLPRRLTTRPWTPRILPARRPYGFLERFDPGFTPNTTDMDGQRYTYGQQPTIGQWNLAQLAQALMAGELLDLVRPLVLVGTCECSLRALPQLHAYSSSLLDSAPACLQGPRCCLLCLRVPRRLSYTSAEQSLAAQEAAQAAVGEYATVLKDTHNELIGRKMGLRAYKQACLRPADMP